MTVFIPVIAAWWLLCAFVAWSWCAAAGRADEHLEGWRNRGESK